MVLVMLRIDFILTERIAYKEEYLLSARELRGIMVRAYAQKHNVVQVVRTGINEDRLILAEDTRTAQWLIFNAYNLVK